MASWSRGLRSDYVGWDGRCGSSQISRTVSTYYSMVAANAWIFGCCFWGCVSLTYISLPTRFLFPEVSKKIGMPRARDTTEAVFASFISNWNIPLKSFLPLGAPVPVGCMRNRLGLLLH